MPSESSSTITLTPEKLLNHWQGHRRLTRKVIEAFPEDKLFTHSVGSMRPFAELVKEFLGMAVPIVQGVATGKWTSREVTLPRSKAELLQLWDKDTAEIDALWPTIPAHRFREVDKPFGMWEGEGVESILYALDNEIHHRGQGYVYLRSLGIEPPAFWERG